MKLSSLSKIVDRSKKRLGRGHGSGKVKTGGRGTKGQKARGKVHLGFEGGQLPIIKRLPLLRGKDRNRSQRAYSEAVAVERLGVLPKGTKVTLEILKKHGMIDRQTKRAKILGGGKLSVGLIVALPVSQTARKAIEQAGGTVETLT